MIFYREPVGYEMTEQFPAMFVCTCLSQCCSPSSTCMLATLHCAAQAVTFVDLGAAHCCSAVCACLAVCRSSMQLATLRLWTGGALASSSTSSCLAPRPSGALRCMFPAGNDTHSIWSVCTSTDAASTVIHAKLAVHTTCASSAIQYAGTCFNSTQLNTSPACVHCPCAGVRGARRRLRTCCATRSLSLPSQPSAQKLKTS